MASETGYKRELSTFDLVAIGVGTVLGSGWLFLPAVVLSTSGPSSILAWLFGAAAMFLMAVVFAELSGAWPEAGGVARFPYFSHGTFTGHMAGWGAYLTYCMIPPVEANAVVRYIGYFDHRLVAPSTALTASGLAIAAAILLALNYLNYLGVHYVGRFMRWVMILKLIPMALFIVLMFLNFHMRNITGTSFMPFGGSGFMLGIAATIFAFTSFRQPIDYAAEAKNAKVMIPRALITSQIIITIALVVLSIAFIGGIHWTLLSRFGVHGFGDWSALAKLPAPLADLATAAGVAFIGYLVLADGIFSPNGPNATNIGSAARVAYALGRNGSLPKALTQINSKGIPLAGLWVSAIIEIIFLVALPTWSQLVAVVVTAILASYAIGPVALASLRRTQPNVERPFNLHGYKFWAPVAFVVSSLLIYWSAWPATGLSLGVILLGVVVYAFYGGPSSGWGSVKHGVWLMVYLVVMALLSWLGNHSFGGLGVLPTPWDLIAVAVVSLACYYWGVAAAQPAVLIEEANTKIG
ncbi:MAG: APC family permease [Thermaerobacter sp.]|nr:APC family permease [Thermaerobacter sp.]